MIRRKLIRVVGLLGCLALFCAVFLGRGAGQEKSVRPDINKNFKDPDPKVWVKKFETESREVWTHREKILTACKVRPGMVVADVGAGTGLFTRLLAKEVGPRGKVYAVDIAQKFVDYIVQACKKEGLQNVVGVVCTQTSAQLPPSSVDVVFLCDTYHHFEFPYKTMATIHSALRPGGQVILIDFNRIKGVSSDWIMGHVRAGKEVFSQEIKDSGFKLVGEVKFLKENYFLRFQKGEKPATKEKAFNREPFIPFLARGEGGLAFSARPRVLGAYPKSGGNFW